MKVSVYDTYYTKPDGSVLHFDVIAPVETPVERIFQYAEKYLNGKGMKGTFTTSECKFCHVEPLQSFMEDDIKNKGYYLLEMQGCG